MSAEASRLAYGVGGAFVNGRRDLAGLPGAPAPSWQGMPDVAAAAAEALAARVIIGSRNVRVRA